MRIAIVALLGMLAGCSTTQTSTAPSSAAGPAVGPSAGLSRAYNACQTAYDRSANPTRTSRAQCLNNAESRFAGDFPDPEMLRQQQGLRLTLAQRVDSGQITQAAADKAYVKEMTRLQAASNKRLAAG